MKRYQSLVVTWAMTIITTLSPTLGYAQEAADSDARTLSYVTQKATAAVIVRSRRVLTAPSMNMLPTEILTAAGQQELGIDPLDIVELLAFAEAPAEGPPGYGAVVRFAKAYDLAKIRLPITWPVEQSELNDRLYLQSQNPMTPGFYMPDDKTLLIAPHHVINDMLASRQQPAASALIRLLAKADAKSDILAIVMLDPVRPMLNAVVAQGAGALPPPLQGVARLPDLIEAAKLDVRILDTPGASLALLSPDEEKATELVATLNNVIDVGQQMILQNVVSELDGEDPIQVATAQYTQRITKQMLDAVRPVQSGRVARILYGQESDNMQVASIGVLVALLLPAVQSAREAARRMQSSNNLKQIAIAMHNYHDAHGTLPPPAGMDADGKPLLSWRVHLLPFVGHAELYEQFHLDEPWDSEHNSTLIEAIPAVYRNPSSSAAPSLANFLVPVGDGSIFATPEGTGFGKISDGTSNTILVVEVNDDASVIWTKPEDFDYDPARPMVGLGSAHPGGFQVSLADGSVRFISNTIDRDTFLNLLMMADGNDVRLD
ncbi:MAG: DUF1559 domain-containing protein [Planctomycetes bacterium]|nr:DUF1559 domain-containing protein [Planctomycetota bacterium]